MEMGKKMGFDEGVKEGSKKARVDMAKKKFAPLQDPALDPFQKLLKEAKKR
jgi:hypothetical protein